ncbi:MAG: LapA family protein [Fuerstiella sp.]
MKYAIGAILILFVVIVTFQNTEQVEATLLLTTISLPMAFLLFATLAIGFVLGMLTTGILLTRRKKRQAAAMKQPAQAGD